jgi:hypothetical protein
MLLAATFKQPMGQTQCHRCGGQISSNSTTCPWCGRATAFNLAGPLFVVALLLGGVGFGLGLIRWQWLEQSLGLDRGFVDQVIEADSKAASGAAQGGGDNSWRLAADPSHANDNSRPLIRRGTRPAPEPEPLPAPVARVAAVVQEGRSVSSPPGGPGCADSSAVGRLVARYPAWANSDLALISCGAIRAGFSSDQVRASLGRPSQVVRAGPGREQWKYNGISVLVEQGRVISYGQ